MRAVMKRTLLTTLVSGAVFGAPSVAMAEEGFISGGKVTADLRLRNETVTQDNAAKDATALTLRTRVGVESGTVSGFSAAIEFEDTSALVDEYANEQAGFSLVPDPVGNEINQAKLMYGMGDTKVIAGRQRVILDNARFVGNVGWRQREQTFDAVVVSSKMGETNLTYGFVDKVNTILGTQADVTTHLLNVSDKVAGGKLTGYAYIYGNDEDTKDRSIIGARYSGGEGVKYTVEYAMQSAYDDNKSDIDANYLLAEVGTEAAGVNFKLGYEVLGSGTDGAFDTPTATKHAFNGWADTFLKSTPGDGLKDTYLSAMTKVGGVKLLGVYHMYAADAGSNDYGSEINLLAAKKFEKNYTLLMKYASYTAKDGNYVDTDKLWLMAEAKF